MRAPSLSIVTICYRNPAELKATLDQLAALDRDVFEVLIVDGSPDESCAAVARAHPWARHAHGPDGGKYSAMNKGVMLAKGDALLFINSGDALDSVATLVEIVAAHRDVLAHTIVYGAAKYVVEARTFVKQIDPSSPLEARNLPSHQSILIPALYHRNHLYDEGMHFAADTKFLKRAFAELPSIYVPRPIGAFSYGGVSTSPGSWAGVISQYREINSVETLTALHKARLAIRLVTRKIARTLFGEAGLKVLQGRRTG
jgi:glycosyltransferase involved in cell wall biosynthesis